MSLQEKPRGSPESPDRRAEEAEQRRLHRRLRLALRSKQINPRLRTFLFVLEVVLVLGLLVWWLSSRSVQQSKSLWVLFLYSFPAEFIISTVPHEPVILYFSKFYPPLLTALVSVAGLVLTEIINYTVFQYVADLRLFRRMLESRVVQKSVNLFNKAPFLTLWVCGFTPIPFYPLRFLVVLARYPLWKYILAVFTSRLPRIYLIALLGDLLSFPDYVIFGIFGLLLAVALAPLFFQLFKKRQKKRLAASPPLGQDGDGLPPE